VLADVPVDVAAVTVAEVTRSRIRATGRQLTTEHVSVAGGPVAVVTLVAVLCSAIITAPIG